MSIAYRKEVDGLRAVAVLPVVLFHAGFQEPSGGFIGVDVFFVISGFLITSIILSEHASETFTLSGFYERRARRILPALFTVALASLVAAYFFLLPDALVDFSNSLAAASVFGSNIFFWHQSGYFAPEAADIPLLHTWSLAVEEQFYLLFPLLLLLLVPIKKAGLIVGIVIVALASLVLAHWGSTRAPDANFYLLPSRAWELMVGALLAIFLMKRNITSYLGPATRNVLAFGGLTLVIASFVVFDKATPFPSLYAIIPVAGAALLLVMATSDTLVGRFLGSKPFVLVGLLSYSIYLWHVPLLSFAKASLVDPPSLELRVGLIAATFVLALATWKFVETPLRNRQVLGKRTILIGAASISLIFAAGGLTIAMNDGFRDRFSSYYLTFKRNKARQATWRYVRRDLKGEQQPNSSPTSTAKGEAPRIKVAVLGNSHAKDMYNALHLSGLPLDLEPVITNRLCKRFPLGSAQSEKCNYEFIYRPDMKWSADRYIIAPRWSSEKSIEALPKVLDRLARLGKPVAVFGSTAEFADIPDYFAKSVWLSGDDSARNLRRIERRAGRTLRVVEGRDERVREIAERHGATYFDRVSLTCPQQRCTLLDDNLKLLLYDYGHTTLEGAAQVAKRLTQSRKFVDFIGPETLTQASGRNLTD
jgi:peptidoglycan/LPS O-acetylase OafA/YrhL